jgi:hypothetical protein
MERSLVGWKKLYLSKRGRLYRIIEYLGKLHTKPYGSALPL